MKFDFYFPHKYQCDNWQTQLKLMKKRNTKLKFRFKFKQLYSSLVDAQRDRHLRTNTRFKVSAT